MIQCWHCDYYHFSCEDLLLLSLVLFFCDMWDPNISLGDQPKQTQTKQTHTHTHTQRETETQTETLSLSLSPHACPPPQRAETKGARSPKVCFPPSSLALSLSLCFWRLRAPEGLASTRRSPTARPRCPGSSLMDLGLRA